MYPTPTLAEAPPNNNNNNSNSNRDDLRPVSHLPASPENHAVSNNATTEDHVPQTDGASPPVRKDTNSSISTTATALTAETLTRDETPGTSYSSVASSPTFAAHPVFSARDGSNVTPQRRASRRRTGPLTTVQRERAHLIRKMGACPDCRRRRVACHPNHHSMTWEEAARRFRSHESSSQGLSPIAGPQLSPAPLNARPSFIHDPREMDLDTSPSQQHAQPVLSEARIRTPLPSGPRPEKHVNMAPLPGFDTFRADLQGSADRILANPFRSRYANVSVLLVGWQDDEDPGVHGAIQDLAKTFHEDYSYTVQTKSIPTSTEESRSSWLWLSQVLTDFVADHDQRDCLKIFYYGGYSYLDGDRQPILASSKHADPAAVIRWSGIQHCFEEARSDALLLLDCAYYPSFNRARRKGMLELIAASAGEDHVGLLGRSAFTRTLANELRTRAMQPFKEPFSAAELHSRLLSLYPRMIQEQNPEKEVITRFPTPLSMQLSGTKTLPSILLAPLRHGEPPAAPPSGSQISITFRLADDTFNTDSWAEWLRLMPEGITEARVDGPYRNTFQ
ncbi:hypothetical protein C8A00DRAFT_16424 [Chaetomidium leptoderma]|uniref:Uncharacterized protein n=1 Tax=Chaetomidium leptoderma TaxID=669021 RepID=A0AAN6VJ45_9PEZI|nr:hypothetical protein C8A00DRAFT_16424 [Chaetomidium leptoderma]